MPDDAPSSQRVEEFPDRMGASDSLMWRIERDPLLCSNITAVSVLDGAPDWGRLLGRVMRMTDIVPRLRQRVASAPLGLASPRWEVDPSFDLDTHLNRRSLDPGATLESVLDLAATNAMKIFDRRRPLWSIELVEGLEDGRAALIQRIHHSVADGIAGLRLVAELLDLERHPAQPLSDGNRADSSSHETYSAGARAPRGPAASVIAAVRAGTATSARLSRFGARVLRSPAASAADLADTARWTARLLAPVGSPLSPLMRERELRRRFEAFDVPLAGLKSAGQVGGGKLNDAYLAAVIGGLGRYHAELGTPVEALRITLPISIRRPQDPVGTNRVTLVRFAVPVVVDPAERIRRINELTAEWRNGKAPTLTDLLAKGLNALPTHIATPIFGNLLKSSDFVATNVPGSPIPVYLAGSEVLNFYAFAPTIGSAINVALISHVDRCCIGLNIDVAAVSDADLLRRSVLAGFDEVLSLSG